MLGAVTKLIHPPRGSESMATRMVSKTMNPGSNPGSPASLHQGLRSAPSSLAISFGSNATSS